MRLASLLLPLALLCFPLFADAAPLFSATPLTNFKPGQKYLGIFSGYLYGNSNAPAANSRHDLDGRHFARKVKPRDASGAFDPVGGKIVVVGLGISNWTHELCVPVLVTQATIPPCTAASFFNRARSNPAVNNRFIVFVDCAAGAQTAGNWIDDNSGLYTRCASILAANNVTKEQVQVILWKDADPDPQVSLSPTVRCSKALVPSSTTPDACKYEHFVAEVARFVKTEYPNVRQMFLHSRIYGGYATGPLTPTTSGPTAPSDLSDLRSDQPFRRKAVLIGVRLRVLVSAGDSPC